MFQKTLLNIFLACLLMTISGLQNKLAATTLAQYLVELSDKALEIEGHKQPSMDSSISIKRQIFTNSYYPIQKSIRIESKELQDNSGLKYLGGVVSAADLSPYLSELEGLLGDSYSRYRENQAKRDHQLFHLTLINPNEYQFIDKATLLTEQHFTITLQGLGQVKTDKSESFFVVAHSTDVQFFRQKYILPAKDLHVTLGFAPDDIYGVSKNISTLIKKP